MVNVTDRALAYVNIKPRTEEQVRKHLRKKGFSDGDIEESINTLKEYHYLDDVKFAEMYYEYSFERGRGRARAERELREKGIDSETIEEAFNMLESKPDQREMARQVGMQIIENDSTLTSCQCSDTSKDYNTKQKIRAKVARRLASRGFPPDIVYSIVKELIP